jgi:hypothetical protein
MQEIIMDIFEASYLKEKAFQFKEKAQKEKSGSNLG